MPLSAVGPMTPLALLSACRRDLWQLLLYLKLSPSLTIFSQGPADQFFKSITLCTAYPQNTCCVWPHQDVAMWWLLFFPSFPRLCFCLYVGILHVESVAPLGVRSWDLNSSNINPYFSTLHFSFTYLQGHVWISFFENKDWVSSPEKKCTGNKEGLYRLLPPQARAEEMSAETYLNIHMYFPSFFSIRLVSSMED